MFILNSAILFWFNIKSGHFEGSSLNMTAKFQIYSFTYVCQLQIPTSFETPVYNENITINSF